MIERITKRLNDWADAMAGGFSTGVGSQLGSMIDSRTAEFTSGKRRRVCDHTVVKISDAEGEREVVRKSFRPALETARGVQTVVSRHRRVDVDSMAMDVADAVANLPVNLQECVHIFYFDGGLALQVRAKKMNVSVKTMYRRLDTAHIILDSALYGSELPGIS